MTESIAWETRGIGKRHCHETGLAQLSGLQIGLNRPRAPNGRVRLTLLVDAQLEGQLEQARAELQRSQQLAPHLDGGARAAEAAANEPAADQARNIAEMPLLILA